MLLAAPGVGKTTVALNWAALSGARTLYCSADTDAELMTEQLASLATGHHRETVAGRMEDNPRWLARYADAIKWKYPHLVMDFEASPNINTVAEKCEALTEVWGETPDLVVIDTASDVNRDTDDPSGWIRQWIAQRELSRFFNCTVMTCHHVKVGPAANGKVAPSQGDGLFNADRFSEIVLGLHTSGPSEITLTALKNRGGRKDVAFPLTADLEYCRVLERNTSPSTRSPNGDEVLPWLQPGRADDVGRLAPERA